MGGQSRKTTQDANTKKQIGLDAVAGGLAGAVSRFVVGPLDVVKIRMQVQLEPVRRGGASKYTGVAQAVRCVLREEGVRVRPGPCRLLVYLLWVAVLPFKTARVPAHHWKGCVYTPKSGNTSLACHNSDAAARYAHLEPRVQGLWRGTLPALVLTAPYCAVQFTVLNQAKAFIRAHSLDASRWRNFTSFLGGATAGAAATVASYPFDLLRTVLASQGQPAVYRGMGDAAAGLFRQRGIAGLYAGLGITLAEIIPYAGVQFGTYDLLCGVAERQAQGRPLSDAAQMGRTFLIGLASGIAGKVRTKRALFQLQVPGPACALMAHAMQHTCHGDNTRPQCLPRSASLVTCFKLLVT
jgi:Mitochondrial carrier protein